MNIPDRTAIVIAKCAAVLIRVFRVGAGATWPGEIALRLRPNLLSEFAKLPIHVVLVAGTNGKTTTVKMLETILSVSRKRLRRNASGANLENGIVSTFIADCSCSGRLRSDTFLFEVDEAAFPRVCGSIHPSIVVLLNLFRDQLDRYGEVDAIAEKWLPVLAALPKTTCVVANADDPHIVFLTQGINARVSYFGLEDPSLFLPKPEHATDTIYCPRCGHRLTFAGVYFSHLGKWTCGKCGLLHPDVLLKSSDYDSPVEGVYNKYNTLAAALVAEHLEVDAADITKGLLSFVPAFGRMESVIFQGKPMTILLSKNPTGFNESLRTVLRSEKHGPMLIVLNDRIPDGTDISWIWDVDFEQLAGYPYRLFAGGDRCYDMGLRLEYALDSKGKTGGMKDSVHPSLTEAVGAAANTAKEGETVWILATYSAMLDVRKIVTGRKIL